MLELNMANLASNVANVSLHLASCAETLCEKTLSRTDPALVYITMEA